MSKCVCVWGEEKNPTWLREAGHKIIRSHTHTHLCPYMGRFILYAWHASPLDYSHLLLHCSICGSLQIMQILAICKIFFSVFFFFFSPVCARVCAAQSGTETTTESSCTGRQQRTKAFQRALSLSFSICVTVRAYVWKRHLKRQRRKKYYLSKTKHWIPLTHFFGGYMVI